MTIEPDAPHTVDGDRLEKLSQRLCLMEKSNRKLAVLSWVSVLLAVVLAIVVIVLMLPAGKKGTDITAGSVNVVDSAGRTRIKLGVDGGGNACVQVMDKDGKAGIKLEVTEVTQTVALLDENGQTRAALEITDKDVPRLSLYDENGRRRVGAAVDSEAGVGVRIADENEKVRLAHALLPDGTVGIVLSDASETARLLISSGEGYGYGMMISDEQGTMRMDMSVGTDGFPMITLLDENGEVVNGLAPPSEESAESGEPEGDNGTEDSVEQPAQTRRPGKQSR